MTDQELRQERRGRWRLRPERRLRGEAEAREFIADVGLCLLYAPRPALVAPTLVGACAGSDDGLPAAQQAFRDPRADAARELMQRLLRQRAAYEAPFAGENILLLSAEVFPYFYALAGERNPGGELQRKGSRHHGSQLERDAYGALRSGGPVSKRRLRDSLGGALSESALDRALAGLWSRLLITRVEYSQAEGVSWDTLERWAPEAVRRGAGLSLAEALSALLSKYLDAAIAAELAEVEAVFSHFASRARVREAANALLAAREVSFVQVGRRSMLQIRTEVAGPRSAAAAGSRRQAAH